MKDFTDLEVWKKARIYRNEIKILSKSFGSEEKYRLTAQIIRSSRSITANIAEGHGRFHFQENIQFCRVARGSLTESKDHLILALDLGFLDKTAYALFLKQYEEILKLLNGYISYLQKRKSENLHNDSKSTPINLSTI